MPCCSAMPASVVFCRGPWLGPRPGSSFTSVPASHSASWARHVAGDRLARGIEQGDRPVVGVEQVVRLAEHPRQRERLARRRGHLELVALARRDGPARIGADRPVVRTHRHHTGGAVEGLGQRRGVAGLSQRLQALPGVGLAGDEDRVRAPGVHRPQHGSGDERGGLAVRQLEHFTVRDVLDLDRELGGGRRALGQGPLGQSPLGERQDSHRERHRASERHDLLLFRKPG